MASVSNGDIVKTAERVWGMLDNLAANNPGEYQKFIKQQLDEGKEALAVPEPRLCLRCPINRSRQRYRYLFINVCAWSRVPKPKTDQDSIPVKGGVLRHVLHGQTKRKTDDLVYDLAFHPKILDECLKDSQLTEMLVGLCLDYVENEVDVCLSDRTLCKKVGIKHKGPLEDIRSSIDEDWRHCLPIEVRLDLEPGAVISKIKEMKTKKDEATVESLANLSLMSDRSTSYSSGKGIASETCSDLRDCRTASMQLPGGESSTLQGRVLIEELSSSTTRSEESICTPEHSMKVLRAGQLVEISKRGCKPGDVLHVVVKLPGVGGVQDVELEVSESDLELTVPDLYHLLMEFPHSVDDEQTRARFDTTHSELIIIVPCRN